MGKPAKTAKKPAKKKKAAKKKTAKVVLGCCTVRAPSVADRQIPRMTEEACKALTNSQTGVVASWVKGACA